MWLTDFPDVVATNNRAMSVDDRIAAKIVEDSIKKENGRYMLKMPFKTDPMKIPNNKIVAEKRLKYLKNKLLRQPHLQEGYIKTVQGYIETGYARKLKDKELKEERKFDTWYIPHHAVTNPKKPGKVRVVFDCAAQFSGKSLNDHLYTGPDVLNSLIGILIRFRQERIAVVGDVEAMYQSPGLRRGSTISSLFVVERRQHSRTHRRVLHESAGVWLWTIRILCKHGTAQKMGLAGLRNT